MKTLLSNIVVVWLLLLLPQSYLAAQQSPNTVGYKITYDFTTARYTVWVVPEYSVPNSNNPGQNELGATAQVTLAVPKDFMISNVVDVRGSWEKNPLKLGPGQPGQDWSASSLNPDTNFYVIGKSAEETNYGNFATGVDVALFTFQGNACFGPVRVIGANELFISEADRLFSLNVANSFYSRSGTPAGGNETPLEQFRNVSGTAAVCSVEFIANDDNVTTPPNTPITISILANDTKDGTPLVPSAYTVVVTSPVNGSASVNPDGTVTYTSTPGFSGVDCFTYNVCELTNPTLCRTANVCVTVPQPNNPETDISIVKTVSQSTVNLNDEVTFSVVVRNNGLVNATNLVIRDDLPAGLAYVSGATTVSNGDYFWRIASLAPGESRTLSLVARVIAPGVTTNTATIESVDQVDPNPTNNVSQVCVGVPVILCQGETLELSAPAGSQNIVWYRDGQQVGTGNTITVTQSGSYTTTSPNSACPTNNCCPVVVITQVCCPAEICVPVTIRKVR